jgi:predicted O-linked N-acetylglucosamine transferase (SPINDLY family)/SAM-dependent methyltransferase
MEAIEGDWRTGGKEPVPPGPKDAELLVQALEFLRAGRLDEAKAIYRRILETSADHFLCLHHLGLIAHQQGDHSGAARLLEQALEAKPDYVEACSNLAAIYRAMGKLDESIDIARRALALDRNFAQAYSNLGNALEDKGHLEAALTAYRRGAAANPHFTEAHVNAANVLRKLGRREEAVATCEEIIARRPDAAEPHFSLGNILKELQKPGMAIASYRRALELKPRFVEVYANLGNALQADERFEEAIEAYRQALAIEPNLAEAHANMGAALDNLGRSDEAIEAFRAAVTIDPRLIGVRVWLNHKRRTICDWDGIVADEDELRRLMEVAPKGVHPFAILGMATSPQDQLHVSRALAASFPTRTQDYRQCQEPPETNRKLKVGYLSSDFCRHATALLAIELFERHDSSRFEIYAYSHGPDDHSELGARLRAAFEHFVDLRGLSDAAAADLIHADGIDILIELKGYTKGARTGIAALRPAPVQVSYLGFPGTMGADFIDYVIADSFVLPIDQQTSFAEKIVHLPHCYQPNDSRRLIADLTPTRMRCGLPEQGFVFCSFNNSYKITPEFFDIWMRLLRAVEGSVLWLLDTSERAKANLAKEAQKRGIDPARLIFAPKVPSPEHLARHRLADLFLDTLPYNAHTTASDALWAGLPVLTCAGTTFAGRVAGSLLEAIGLQELITVSLADYEALALRLAREPGLLMGLRERLLANRLKAPLFDSAAYARHFEAALAEMWRRWTRGEPPGGFAVMERQDQPPQDVPAPDIARVPFLRCPLCESENIPAVLAADCSKHALYQPMVPKVMNWHECGDCGHVFTEGYFDAKALDVLFAKTHAGQTVGHDMERQRYVSARIVERVARHRRDGNWLDVGFGNGSLLFTAEEWGYRPVGLDLRRPNVESLSVLGYEAHCLSLEALDHDGRYDVVSMADVLEHLPFPKLGLAAAHRLLRPDGILFLSMPNMGNMVWRLLHANQVNPYWGELEHYHNFSRQRLYRLLEQHGFVPLEYSVSERYRVCMEVIAVRRS